MGLLASPRDFFARWQGVVSATGKLPSASAQRQPARHDRFVRGLPVAYLLFFSCRNFSRWAVNSSRSAQPWK
jgi:hypothetical protein